MTSGNRKILVTGANGFLGKNILKAFAQHEDVELVAACRDKRKLPDWFQGEVREGDLRNPDYRNAVVHDIDVICHAGTWAAMWDHAKQEHDYFYLPTVDFIEKARTAGVKRFLMASTVAIAKPSDNNLANDDFSETAYTRFWPHLDYLIDVDTYMKRNANPGMQMITLRLGHFVGAGNTLGLVPVLVPRLKTWLVPWLAGGTRRLPLTADTDLGRGFVAAALAEELQAYESFNICGTEFPTTREVISFVTEKTGLPKPIYSVPYLAGYAFAWLMEKLYPVMPGKAPFLTRSIVHLAEEWVCTIDYAEQKLGYRPEKDWRTAMEEALAALKTNNYPWPYLSQAKV